MILRSFYFRKVVIVGVGLMGGSLGMALRKHGLAKEVVGFSRKQSSLMQALKYQAVDVAEADLPKALKNADLVVLATPVDAIIKLLPTLAKHLRRGALVTDLGSTKADIVENAEKILGNNAFFVGSHPLVGSEKQGVENARAELFEGGLCILTPTGKSNPGVVKRIQQLWLKVGATVKEMTPQAHDEALAFVSHLPHLLAYTLLKVLPDDVVELTPQSFKDMTRIAASSPQIWAEICLSNPRNIVKSLDNASEQMAVLRKAIVQKNSKALEQYFTEAQQKRSKIDHGK